METCQFLNPVQRQLKAYPTALFSPPNESAYCAFFFLLICFFSVFCKVHRASFLYAASAISDLGFEYGILRAKREKGSNCGKVHTKMTMQFFCGKKLSTKKRAVEWNKNQHRSESSHNFKNWALRAGTKKGIWNFQASARRKAQALDDSCLKKEQIGVLNQTKPQQWTTKISDEESPSRTLREQIRRFYQQYSSKEMRELLDTRKPHWRLSSEQIDWEPLDR